MSTLTQGVEIVFSKVVDFFSISAVSALVIMRMRSSSLCKRFVPSTIVR